MKQLLFLFFMSTILSAHDLTVNVTGIRGTKGGIIVKLYNRKKDFPKEKSVYKRVYSEFNAATVAVTFADIPTGDYAVLLYHDKNGNRKVDTNLIGIPKEPHGISRNIKLFGPPKFDKCKFHVTADTSISVRVNY